MESARNFAAPHISERSVYRAVTLRTALSLSAVAALAIIGWMLLSAKLAEHSALDQVAAHAGAQRMLSQEMAGLVAEYIGDEGQAAGERTLAQLLTTQAKYLAVYRSLTQSADGHTPPSQMNPDLRAAYFDGPESVAAATEKLQADLHLLASGKMSRAQAYACIDWMRGKLVGQLDRALREHRKAASQALQRSRLLHAEDLVAMLILLLLEAVLIFEPLARKLASQTTVLLQQSQALQSKTEEMQKLASTDGLTQLANRRALEAAMIRQAQATGVIYFDLDCFKYINDAYGHGAGDAVLCAVGDRLRSVCRTSDLTVRMGGDEFAVILYDLPAIDDVMMIAERIRAAVQVPVAFEGRQLCVGASIGTCIIPDEAKTLEQALKHADHAQRAAKQHSKARGEAWRDSWVSIEG